MFDLSARMFPRSSEKHRRWDSLYWQERKSGSLSGGATVFIPRCLPACGCPCMLMDTGPIPLAPLT